MKDTDCKGLCADCDAVLPNGVPCRMVCEPRVAPSNQGSTNQPKDIHTDNLRKYSVGICMLLIGVVFCLSGFLPLLHWGDKHVLVIGILGLFCTAYGVIRLTKKSPCRPMS